MSFISNNKSTVSRHGFTLVEIMIVVVIIGLLATIAMPAFKKARISSYSRRFANDFRVFSSAFETHHMESGQWAPDGSGNSLPATVQPYLEGSAWYQTVPGGGYWDWEFERLGYTAAVALVLTTDMPEAMLKVDELLDDGNLGSGQFVKVSGSYLYVLE